MKKIKNIIKRIYLGLGLVFIIAAIPAFIVYLMRYNGAFLLLLIVPIALIILYALGTAIEEFDK